jgi:arsenate reductase-like glutaredoxin family protein
MNNTMPKYIVYTMNGCSFCNQAKALLEYYGVDYELIYDKSPDWETYPCIYKSTENGELQLIGGFQELANYSHLNGL